MSYSITKWGKVGQNERINFRYTEFENFLKKTGFSIENIQLVKDNDNASSYATGLMIFQASNQMTKKNTMVKE